ncbi:hypothetical protein Moror_2595 [Moniliophthora roreri MCA 2997]|uniref:Uncharacterized protein n=2 Tax=Moniliophthora roreri TaxID=221103 RepID=V2XFC9_MONRO|nr:hypothetical protein Moror_2595 [Moniliophthora roreri MCA 2997]KAI3619440.1 hypothetical protein WG66_012979 [Moniliophthora roreri]
MGCRAVSSTVRRNASSPHSDIEESLLTSKSYLETWSTSIPPMAPVPTTFISATPSSAILAGPVASPTTAVLETILSSTAILESMLTTTTSSLPQPFVITFLVLIALYASIPRIFDWRYPVRSSQMLRNSALSTEQSIQASRRAVGVIARKNILKLKERLRTLHTDVVALEARTEPSRSSLITWVTFKWKMVRDVDECHTALKALQAEVQAKLGHVQEQSYYSEIGRRIRTSAVENE